MSPSLISVLILNVSVSVSAVGEDLSSSSEDDDDSAEPDDLQNIETSQSDKGTAGKESEAGAEISALVNYVQPVHFSSFDNSKREV
jgi:phosphatidylinositol phospholipase C beta